MIRRRTRVVVFAGLALPALVVVLPIWGLGAATRWLYQFDSPVPSELMVVLGGGSSERLQTAVELYAAGMAPRILSTSASGFPDIFFERLVQNGVPRRALVAPLSPSTSTLEDAFSIRQVVQRERVGSILVVTSPYHCRRARMAVRRSFRDLDVRVTVTPSISLYMDAEQWWKSRQGWITVGKEFPKLARDWLVGPFTQDRKMPN